MLRSNGTLRTWTGHGERDTLAGTPFHQLLSVGSRLFYETHLRPLLHLQGHVTGIALEMHRIDGTVLPVLVNAVLDRLPDGSPSVTRVAVFDATERRRYEQELLTAKERAEVSERRAQDLARRLQETLLPPRHPQIEGLQVATAYRAAGDGTEIGGDFYDVFELAQHDWIVTLGDVAGKGVEAAVVATLARHTVRAVAVNEPSPAEVLRQLNQVLLHHPSDRFCTAVVLRMRRTGDLWDVTMATGGHPPAVLLGVDRFPRTVGEASSLVGIFEAATYDDLRFELHPGNTVLLHTDGVTEARGAGDFYGDDRLMRLLHANTEAPDRLVRRILDDVLDFQGGVARDDIALVALQVPGRSHQGSGRLRAW